MYVSRSIFQVFFYIFLNRAKCHFFLLEMGVTSFVRQKSLPRVDMKECLCASCSTHNNSTWAPSQLSPVISYPCPCSFTFASYTRLRQCDQIFLVLFNHFHGPVNDFFWWWIANAQGMWYAFSESRSVPWGVSFRWRIAPPIRYRFSER